MLYVPVRLGVLGDEGEDGAAPRPQVGPPQPPAPRPSPCTRPYVEVI